MNPLNWWRTLFLPAILPTGAEDVRKIDTTLFFLLLSLLTGVYSLIKWQGQGVQPLVLTSIVLIALELSGAVVLKLSASYRAALNLGFLGMSLHCLNLIYQSGGMLASSQGLWVPVLMVAYFLCAGLLMATLWSLCAGGIALVMVLHALSGGSYPDLTLSASALRMEAITGIVVPLLVIGIALAFTSAQRVRALRQATQSRQESEAALDRARQGEQSLSDVLARVNDNVQQLSEVNRNLEQESGLLQQQVDQLHHNCADQSAAAEQIATELQRLTRDTQRSDQFVSELNQHSDSINREAERSAGSLEASGQAISRILDANDKITGVAALITQVAEQTNLLALNAAIEAARAGSHGRGFAVVADQVRELSAQSNQAAKEIRSILDLSRREVEQGQSVIGATNNTISGILSQVAGSREEVGKLTGLIAQQASSVEELSTAGVSVSDTARETAEVAGQVADQRVRLAEQVEVVRRLTQDLHAVLESRA
ncbi:methyl-accepting chemotaxis protein [Ferrimonas futtsuensis]|uniref:methyl-accepting chemotaxis protein n=1 Tax=Ferrimonas futtsuensis TaxID=364764 RepID=UPI0004062BAB|nr:methyl-accepting chemotaxis protein [Ferrimonas futtsuensis]